MKCEDCRVRMPEYWQEELDAEQQAHMEMHLASCTACREEAETLRVIWSGLGEIPGERPRRELRARFYERLDAYQHGFAEADPPSRERKGAMWWVAAAAMLVIGFAAGFLIDSRRDNVQLAELRNEVGSMRQMVTLSLLQQQNASDRLKGVNWAYRFERSDTDVLAALLHTVNHDASVSVRLAAVDAMRSFEDSPIVRKAVVQAIGKQDSPMVQIALIDQLTDLHEREAVPALQSLAQNAAVNPEVRQRAQWALGRLQ